ncbi:MAG TPA: hypothetical protein VNT31_07975 [Nocardioides sp.]|nr:hypothetical protein [Nocardioides sp.]
MRRRTGSLFTLLLLAASLVAAVGASTAPASAAPGDYAERWCTVPLVTPCVVSFSINGVAQSAASPVEVLVSEPLDLGGYQEVSFTLGVDRPTPSDQLELVINTGSAFTSQRLLNGKLHLADVDFWNTPDGHHTRVVGRPVVWSSGCDTDAAWPYPCTGTVTDTIEFAGDLGMLDEPDGSVGMYVGTNAIYNGIFLVEQPDGTSALVTELVAPHFREDGVTPVVGSVRFRVSYRHMRDEMGIPNPETLVTGSLAGTVNGGTGGGSFTGWHDADGHGYFIQASGFTFSLKRLKVRAVRITPTKPRITKTQRVLASRARVYHTYSKPRGAKVTSYLARCVNSGGHVVRDVGSAGSTLIVVDGLRRGRAYTCRVVARSRAGSSVWSDPVRVAARPG